MTREELKAHCEKQIEMCEKWAISNGKIQKPSGRIYEEHKLILELLEQEPFINKPCVSSGVCEHDKNKVLDKISAEITAIAINGQVDEHTMFIRAGGEVKQMALDIIDKYKAESENP